MFGTSVVLSSGSFVIGDRGGRSGREGAGREGREGDRESGETHTSSHLHIAASS
jgi:hypothetical protein